MIGSMIQFDHTWKGSPLFPLQPWCKAGESVQAGVLPTTCQVLNKWSLLGFGAEGGEGRGNWITEASVCPSSSLEPHHG